MTSRLMRAWASCLVKAMAERTSTAREEMRRLLLGAEVYPLVGAVRVPEWMARLAASNMDDDDPSGSNKVVAARRKLKEMGRNAAVEVIRERGYVEARRERDLLEEEFKREEAEYKEYYDDEIQYRHHVMEAVEAWLNTLRGEEGAEFVGEHGKSPVVVREKHLGFDDAAPWSWRLTRSEGDVWARVLVQASTLKE